MGEFTGSLVVGNSGVFTGWAVEVFVENVGPTALATCSKADLSGASLAETEVLVEGEAPESFVSADIAQGERMEATTTQGPFASVGEVFCGGVAGVTKGEFV